jgi:glucose-6-phosphate-specific signal transduction histidine kinase
VVYLFRKHSPIEIAAGVHVGRLLGCSLILSGMATLRDFGALASIKLPSGYHVDVPSVAARWVLGNFLGILTIVPVVLVVAQVCRARTWHVMRDRLLESLLVKDTVLFLIPALAILVWFGGFEPGVRALVQAALFLPVVWIALRHGWSGAAVGGMLASFAIMVLMPARNDASTLQAEIIVAFAISTMLLVGERVAALRRMLEQEKMGLRLTLALAQRNVAAEETRLKVAAQGLTYVQETVRAGYQMMLGRLRAVQPVSGEYGYGRQVLIAQDQLYRLADCLHPITWRDRGLPAALREGSLARMLGEEGIAYRCDIYGPVDSLSSTLHLAIYRVVGEAIACWCKQRDLAELELRLRCGNHGGRRWVVLRLVGRGDAERIAKVRWEELLPRVMRVSSGLGLDAVRDRAATYEGHCRERCSRNSRWLTVSMLDPAGPGDI